MANPLLQHYIKLTEFLGQALGPDYEVALHDMTDKNRSIVAIANNHISGREIGAPLTNVALKILMDKSYETQDYRLHYCGLSAEGKTLRSSTMFIKHNSKLVGMLCINFDDSRFHEISDAILKLIHPDDFVHHHYFGVTADRLTPDERMQIIASLENGGIFLLKGAVKDVADALHCSQASVYRYLSQIKKDDSNSASE